VRKSKIDPALIRVLIEQGLSDLEIADRVGCTVGTLRVRCSQLKISLRRPGKVVLPQAILDQLIQRAKLMGVSTTSLAADLLEEIARDDLYDAVLDRDDATLPCAVATVQ
jgi:transcriptional regulator with XRE-family HTH domain